MFAPLPGISNMCVNEQQMMNAYTLTKVEIFWQQAALTAQILVTLKELRDGWQQVLAEKCNSSKFVHFSNTKGTLQ